MLLSFVGPKHPSGNCYVSYFLTDSTALIQSVSKSRQIFIYTQKKFGVLVFSIWYLAYPTDRSFVPFFLSIYCKQRRDETTITFS